MPDSLRFLDRSHSNSLKWQRYQGRDIIPAWVADMDIATPDCIIQALEQRLRDHPLLGYEVAGQRVLEAVRSYLLRYHDWEVEPEAIVFLPGIVPALHWCCALLGEAGDEILVPAPVYPPFLSAPIQQGRRCIRLRHIQQGRYWTMDMEDWESQVSPRSRALLFCHPHNPLGRCWNKEELQRVTDFCRRHNLLLISDEIHCQLILDQSCLPFQSPAKQDDWTRKHSITLLAPSKTYNIPGMCCAFAVIENPDLRSRLRRIAGDALYHITPLSYQACAAAYEQGEAWRQQLVDQLRHNRNVFADAVSRWPGVSDCHIEATYLSWLDMRGLACDDPHAACEAGGIGLSDGRSFGRPGFVRVNLATSASLLAEIIDRMERVVQAHAPG